MKFGIEYPHSLYSLIILCLYFDFLRLVFEVNIDVEVDVDICKDGDEVDELTYHSCTGQNCPGYE